MTIPEPLDGERRPPRRGPIVLAMTAVVAVVAATSWWMTTGTPDAPLTTTQAVAELDPEARAPEGVRIKVRVLNTTDTRGLARRMTNLVRDLGYDVVDYGNGREMGGTMILVHNNEMDWGRRLAKGLLIDSVSAKPDSLHYVDLTVIIGADWKPPASQPFRP